jgi:phenylpropionate dioxygenase-like ring-hydroxylating dioxygenase large terminal subunit
LDHSTELALIRRCIEARDAGSTTTGPTGRSPAARYLSSERYQHEVSQLFAALPAPRAHSSQLAVADSYLRVQSPLGELLLTRDAEGQVHAFHNICRHRGSQLVSSESGCATRHTCPYHAWSYSSSGELLAIPFRDPCFGDVDPADLGLLAVPCVEKFGMIWVCPGAEPDKAEVALTDYLGDLASGLEWLGLERLSFFNRTRRSWRANWKVLAEGGLETYHFSVAHRDTIGPHFLRNTAVIDQIGPHFRVVMPNKRLQQMADLPEDQWHLRESSHTLFSLFPGDSLLLQRDHLDWINMRPLSPSSTEITITSLVPGDPAQMSEEEYDFWRRNLAITDQVLSEDWALGEGIQRSLESGAVRELIYGSNEWALGAFHQAIEKRLGEGARW